MYEQQNYQPMNVNSKEQSVDRPSNHCLAPASQGIEWLSSGINSGVKAFRYEDKTTFVTMQISIHQSSF